MDKKQFATFSMALKTYYPRENLLPNEQALELWFKQLSDIPYEIAEASLNKWVALNKWSPSIADIREMALSITQGDLADWGEAWHEVQKAIQKYGYYRADEALESLTPLTRKVVDRMGFTKICMSENPEASRANFRMIYEQLAERDRREAQMPESLRLLISQVSTKMIEG